MTVPRLTAAELNIHPRLKLIRDSAAVVWAEWKGSGKTPPAHAVLGRLGMHDDAPMDLGAAASALAALSGLPEDTFLDEPLPGTWR